MGFVLELPKLCPALSRTGPLRADETVTTSRTLAKELVQNMQLDKKRSRSGVRLILQKGRGQTFIKEFAQDAILDGIFQNLLESPDIRERSTL